MAMQEGNKEFIEKMVEHSLKKDLMGSQDILVRIQAQVKEITQ